LIFKVQPNISGTKGEVTSKIPATAFRFFDCPFVFLMVFSNEDTIGPV